KLLNILKSVSDASDQSIATLAARIEGWHSLSQPNETANAKVKLSAAKDRDPMARMGLIQTYGVEEQAKARTEAAETLRSEPDPFRRALLKDAVRDLDLKPAPGPTAADLQAALDSLPRNWMNILSNPQSFYLIRAEPVRNSVPFGEPLLARVTIQNV